MSTITLIDSTHAKITTQPDPIVPDPIDQIVDWNWALAESQRLDEKKQAITDAYDADIESVNAEITAHNAVKQTMLDLGIQESDVGGDPE